MKHLSFLLYPREDTEILQGRYGLQVPAKSDY